MYNLTSVGYRSILGFNNPPNVTESVSIGNSRPWETHNISVGSGSEILGTSRHCMVIGTNSVCPDGAENVIIIGNNTIIPKGMPKKNAVYIGTEMDSVVIANTNFDHLAEKINRRYADLSDVPVDEIYIPYKGTFKNLGHEIGKLQTMLTFLEYRIDGEKMNSAEKDLN